MVVVLVVPCPLALRVWWSWHGVDVCGRWWLTVLQGLGAAVLKRSRGGPGHGTLQWTRTSEQAGKALRSQGHHCARVM